MVDTKDIKSWIKAGMPEAIVDVDGDGHHFEARIVSEAFAGLNSLQRHRMVYEILGERMREQIHALSIKTMTPEELK